MEELGLNKKEIEKLAKDYKSRDLGYHKAVSTMTTPAHPIARMFYDLFYDSNLGDPSLFQGTKAMEVETVEMLGHLLGLKVPLGYITSGGHEANIQAIRIACNISGKRKGNIIVPESSHFSFDKIADILNITVKKAELDDEYRVSTDAVSRMIDDETVGLVGIAGTTELGQVDPIKELSELAVDKDLFLHIDAAFGGLVLPFLPKVEPFDFSLEGVSSMTVNPHKMGMSMLPAGGLILREEEYLDVISAESPYLNTKRSFTLTGVRCGASVASAFGTLKFFGKKGMRELVGECMRNVSRLTEGFSELGLSLAVDPPMNIMGVLEPSAVIEKLEAKGWSYALSNLPRSLRVICMPHVNREIVEELLGDLS